MVSKELKLIKALSGATRQEVRTPIATEMFLPNTSNVQDFARKDRNSSIALTATRLVQTDVEKILGSVANLGSLVAGTTNQLTVTDDLDGTITLSTPQDTNTAALFRIGSLGVNVAAPVLGALSIGAHGLTLAVNDFAAGSSSTNFLFWDNSTGKLDLRSTETSLLLTGSGAGSKQWQIVSGGNQGFTIGDFVIYNASSGGRAIVIKAGASTNDAILIDTGGAISMAGYLNVGTTTLAAAQGDFAAGLTAAEAIFYDQSTNELDLGTGYIETGERTAPAAPAANRVRIYCVDNGAGKTQLMAIFPTGAAQQIAIEP